YLFRQTMRLGGREDKFDRWRRLFERLQQSVEGIFGYLMHLVDNIDLESRFGRLVAHVLNALADFIDVASGRAFDFEDVDAISLSELVALRALIARRRRGALFAIQGLGEHPCRGGFAHPTNAGKKIGMSDAIRSDGVLKRARDVLLSRDILKAIGTPFPRNDQISHKTLAVRR